jgi:arginase
VRSGALPLILAGDCISVLGVIAGTRRYYRNVSLIYMDRDADLNVPATTPSGCIDGMVISQVIGRGAPELVRFWGEPPLVREPDIALFGYERLDAPEMQYLVASPLRRHPSLEISTRGGAVAAGLALERVHAAKHEFILHFDVDVIDSGEFPWTNYPGSGGLSLQVARDALRAFTRQQNLAAFVVAGYNPELDADGAGARKLIDLLADVLSVRLEPVSAPAEGTADPAQSSQKADAPSPESEPSVPPPVEEQIPEVASEPDHADSANSSEANEPDASVS